MSGKRAHAVEVVIVGGGIAGCSAAYHLARLGHEVALLERGVIAGEASGVNAGSIDNLGWGYQPEALQTWLTAGSFDIFRSLQLDLGHDIELRRSGGLQAVQNDEQLAWAKQRVAMLESQGARVELLDARAARELEPAANPALYGFVHSPLRAQADPVKATRAFAAEAERQGARVLTGHQVTGLAADGSGITVATPDTVIAGDALVLAAGAWCGPLGALLGLDVPVIPVRGQMWATSPLPPRVFHVISSCESMLHWSETPGGDGQAPPFLTHRGAQRLTRHLYGRQTQAGEIIFGGDRQLAGYDVTPEAGGIEVNHRHAAEVLPFLRELPRSRIWGGLMPFSKDGAPLIGRLRDRPAVHVVSGLGSSGFGRGPMAGKLIADFIHSGATPPVLRLADPLRFAAT